MVTPVTFVSAPAERRLVRGEPAELPPFSADVWTGRYVPRGIMVPFRGQAGTPAPHALESSSLIVREGERVLTIGADYVVDETYGTLCLPAPDARPRAVTLDYDFVLLRIDSIVENSGGERRMLRGVSHLTNPHPPRAGDDEVLVANLLIDGRVDRPGVFTPADASTGEPIEPSVVLPRASTRAVDDPPLRLLFLGDSITEGGDASTDHDTFRAVAERLLRARGVSLDARVAATGGSRSVQWLDPANSACDWERVVSATPDVTVVEFLNDAYLDPQEWAPAYDELVARLTDLGSEVVLMTPPFTMPETMNGTDDVDDGRAYVDFLRGYAHEHGLPLIDVSARWERLRDEGLPYRTLLANGINHPDDRGHRLTGEFVGTALLALLGVPSPA